MGDLCFVTCRAPGRAEGRAVLSGLWVGAVLFHSHAFTNQSVIDCLFSTCGDTFISPPAPGQKRRFCPSHIGYEFPFTAWLPAFLEQLIHLIEKSSLPLGSYFFPILLDSQHYKMNTIQSTFLRSMLYRPHLTNFIMPTIIWTEIHLYTLSSFGL